MMRQVTVMSRTFSTSSMVREVIQANGQSGSNQKSTLLTSTTNRAGREVFRRPLGRSRKPKARGQVPIRSRLPPSLPGEWAVSHSEWQDHGMPGTNLTRDEAATRAALLDVASYSIDLDLTT